MIVMVTKNHSNIMSFYKLWTNLKYSRQAMQSRQGCNVNIIEILMEI